MKGKHCSLFFYSVKNKLKVSLEPKIQKAILDKISVFNPKEKRLELNISLGIKEETLQNKIDGKPSENYNNEQRIKDIFWEKASEWKKKKGPLGKLKDEILLDISKLNNLNVIKAYFLLILQNEITEKSIWEAVVQKVFLNKEQIISLKIEHRVLFLYILSRGFPFYKENRITKSSACLSVTEIIVSTIKKDLEALDPRNFSHLLFTVYRMEIILPELIEKFQVFAIEKAGVFNNQDVAASLFSLGKIYANAGKHHKRSLCKTIEEIIYRIENKQNLFLDKLEETLKDPNTNVQTRSNICWAMSRLKIKNQKLWLPLYDYVLGSYSSIDDNNFRVLVTSILTANRNFNVVELPFGLTVKEEFIRRLNEHNMTVQNVVRIFRALSANKINSVFPPDDPALILVKKFVLKKIEKFSVDELCQTLYSFTYIVYKDDKFFDVLYNEICKKIDGDFSKETSYSLMLAVWCASIGEYEGRSIWVTFQKYLPDFDIINFENKYIMSLYQGMFFLQNFRKDYIINHEFLKEKLNFCKKKVKLNTANDYSESHGKFDIFLVLKAIGFKVISEANVEIYSIDFLIENFENFDYNKSVREIKDIIERLKEMDKLNANTYLEKDKQEKKKALAIEIDGPSHFILSEKYPSGPSVSKERIIKKLGYNLLKMTSQECRQISALKNFDERITKMLDILQKAKDQINN